MMNTRQMQTKNIKKYYVPKTAVIYFSEGELTVLDNLSKLVVEYTQFIQIGAKDVTHHNVYNEMEIINKNRFNKTFYNWINPSKKDDQIYNPASFFSSTDGKRLINELKQLDLVVIVYKSSQDTSLAYVKELVGILAKNDVFAFHFVIENFVMKEQTKKQYSKLINYFTKKKQVFVPIKEKAIVLAYKQATISNRNYYMNLYVNNLIESFISPFLSPDKNADHFSRVKSLIYRETKNFDSKTITTIGYSEDKKDCIDFALIQALSNPIFYGAFKATDTFLVNVKIPFMTQNMIERINYVLKNVVGNKKTFLISPYIGSYDFNVYCQISIMAINVDEDKLINDTTKIDDYVKNVLKEVSKSNELFLDSKTKELILENKIDILEDSIK